MRLLLISLFCLPFLLHAADAGSYAGRSALAEGKWVKLKLESAGAGVYKITYDELRKMGFDDPSKVGVYGYGGEPLSEDFADTAAYIDDLPATAVYRGDNYLLFYGKGYVRWTFNATDGTFLHTNNPYATASYYFLTDAYAPRDMETEASYTGAVAAKLTTFDDYRVHEVESVSPNKSGRELYGESFAAGGSQTISATSDAFRIPGITNDSAIVTMRFIARPKSAIGIATLSLDGEEVIRDLTISPVGTAALASYTVAVAGSRTAAWHGEKSEAIRAVVTYSQSGDENVHLDYVRLQVKRQLKLYGGYTLFRSIDSKGKAVEFTLAGADAGTVVFDVTDAVNPRRMDATLSGSELSFSIPAGDRIREFAAVQTSQTLGGWTVDQNPVGNQDLHGIAQADLVIISPTAFLTQANRLADRHRTDPVDSLSVAVVTPEQVYNEFSSGTPDATAYRRLMKMLYDRHAADEASRPKYLLLFGDGAYDNRHLTTDWKNVSTSNFLLTYQSQNSLDYQTFVTDDYFGSLRDVNFLTNPTGAIELGIGRLPVQTLSQATAAVDKIIGYMDNKVTGAWKNRLAFVADDGSKSDDPVFSNEHMNYANRLAEYVRTSHPEFLTRKIFFDYYKKENGTYEDVKRSIREELNEGLLLINYTGHGSTKKWADEDVLNKETIAGFRHKQLPLWVTATCDFTRFDDSETSAGEDVFLSTSGGIGLFTTTRVVISSNNFNLNESLIQHLFDRNAATGKRLTLGDVMRNTKSDVIDVNKLNFVLIGDPALKLGYPEYGIHISTINGQPASSGDTIAFRAQDKITVTGEVQNLEGTQAAGFNGSLEVTVLDSKQTLTTLDNNGTGNPYRFEDYPNTMTKLNSEVAYGAFEFSFVVPTDISYSGAAGLINLYAYDSENANEAQGSFQRFTVGGSSDNPEEDTAGPEIRALYLNDTTFAEGGTVNATPLFVARLWDQSGVNISGSSVGHDITLTIDNPTVHYNLNTYYRLLPDSLGGEGLVTFSIPELKEGLHEAEFTVWDVFNNSTRYAFTFTVDASLKPRIAQVVATPVPARDHVQFRIYHDRPEATVEVSLMVFDMTGRLKWKHSLSGVSDWDTPLTYDWDLTSNGSRLRSGVYIYRAAIRTAHSKEATKGRKLVIMAQ